MSALAADGFSPTPVLEVENLHTEFHLRTANVKAVDGVSFRVNPGECVGLVGESACGKTTVGLSIMKLLPAVGHVTGGSIRLFGRDLAPYDERQMCAVRGNEIGMIFQDPMTSLNPTWKIGRQIAEVVRLHRKVGKAEAYQRALEVLTLVGMPRPAERLDTYPHQLSGGLRQRVMIAIALACEPKLLIADEPTTALDVTIQAQILNLIDELRERLKMAVILITHDLGVIAARSDRVMVMYAGKIVESATTEELFGSMRHPYSEALLESIPRLDQDRTRRLFSISGLPPDLSRTLVGCRFAPRCRYATDECRNDEPELSPAAQGSAGDRPAEAPRPGPRIDPDDVAGLEAHLYACFHPVTATREERLARRGIVSAHDGAKTFAVAPKNVAPGTPIGEDEAALQIMNLVKNYSVVSGAVIQRKIGTVQAVSDVSFSVRRGETFGLVGESGCGKTTIGRLVVALERPTSGSVRYESTNITRLRGRTLRRRRRDLQMIFQDPYSSLDPRMRVKTIVREPLLVQGIGDRRSQFQRVVQLLGEVGLSAGAAELYPHEFSGGQRQRIGLARALALNPKVIVADEPVSALDVSIQAQILNLMRDLQQRHDLTYIVISHDLAVVKYLADRIGVMYLGKLVETGPAIEIYERTAHPYTQALIDAIPVPDPVVARATHHHIVPGELPSAMAPPSGCRFRTRCPFAQEVCAAEEPPLRLVGADHLTACHFPLQAPLPDAAVTRAAAASSVG
ncbi:MAG TPA: ABC transporter ATP-binding protein [Acidimicrobiales bacterium]|nr:ABC transporter ATP-binding protein [Acidimicrobiales bacterium]